MIKIIQHGQRHNANEWKNIEHTYTCSYCHCIFTATFKDFNYSQFVNKYRIRCPECPSQILKSISDFYE